MSKVLVNFIQDRSGSMQSVWQETLSGFNKFVEDLRASARKDGVEYLFSLTTFDTLVEIPVASQSIETVDVDILAKHGPRGSTALYDAVGITLQNIAANQHDADKIIVVIVTDGHENSSREWDKDKLHSAIDSRLKEGNWSFTYLGTQPETWDDASAFGVAFAGAARYTPRRAGAAYSALASSISRLAADESRRGTPALMADYLSEKEAVEAGIQKRAEPKSEKGSPQRGKENHKLAISEGTGSFALDGVIPTGGKTAKPHVSEYAGDGVRGVLSGDGVDLKPVELALTLKCLSWRRAGIKRVRSFPAARCWRYVSARPGRVGGRQARARHREVPGWTL